MFLVTKKLRETFGVGELFDFVIHEPRAVVGVVCGGGGGISLKRYIASGKNNREMVNKNDYGRISSGHIIPFGNSQDIISFLCFIVT